MNYLSWFGLVVLYPEWTLKKRGLVVVDNADTIKCFSKYVGRGFSLHRDVRDISHSLQSHVCRKDPYCPATTRSLLDGHCLVQAFNSTNFDFKYEEDNAIWSLPVSCICDGN
jgi:hypothetical protein